MNEPFEFLTEYYQTHNNMINKKSNEIMNFITNKLKNYHGENDLKSSIDKFSDYMIDKNKTKIKILTKKFKFLDKNLFINLYIVNSNNTTNGIYKNIAGINIIDLYINLKRNNIEDIEGILNSLKITLSHELTHFYQLFSKNHHTKLEQPNKDNEKLKNIPFMLYFLRRDEIDALLSSVYSKYTSKKRKVPYFECLIEELCKNLNIKYNNDLSPHNVLDNTSKKYQFIIMCIITLALPTFKYFELCKNDNLYKEYINYLGIQTEEDKDKLIEIFYLLEEIQEYFNKNKNEEKLTFINNMFNELIFDVDVLKLFVSKLK